MVWGIYCTLGYLDAGDQVASGTAEAPSDVYPRAQM